MKETGEEGAEGTVDVDIKDAGKKKINPYINKKLRGVGWDTGGEECGAF